MRCKLRIAYEVRYYRSIGENLSKCQGVSPIDVEPADDYSRASKMPKHSLPIALLQQVLNEFRGSVGGDS